MMPALDKALGPVTGSTRDGQPISWNRPPARELAPWIARFYVTQVSAPATHRVDCGLFNDLAFMRIQIGGTWEASTATGPMAMEDAALLFGPHTRRMPVAVTGTFTSLGVSFRPGALQPLFGLAVKDTLDRIVPSTDLAGLGCTTGIDSGIDWAALVDPATDPAVLIERLENALLAFVEQRRPARPDAMTARFEHAAWTDPTFAIGEFARDHAIDQRRLERIIKRDFGLSPKAVLRRSRALDMASHLRGVADEDEGDLLTLRYYDQSHLNREFTQLLGMTPRQFAITPQPLMTAALENRQGRRLEMMQRLEPGAARPWAIAVNGA